MTELDTAHGSALVLHADQERWTEQQLAALKHLLGDNATRATRADLDVYHHVCQRTGLDPFARQIHMVNRQGKWTIQTGIDGLRLVARRAADTSGEAISINGGEWCGSDGIWRDVWLSDEPPAAARVTVRRGDGVFIGTVTYAGYCQRKNNGEPMFRWATDPAGQLAKCAEAKALRMGFPQDLAGVYTDDEMAQADNPTRAEQHGSGLSAARARQRAQQEPPAAEMRLLDTGSELAKAMYEAIENLGVADNERLPFLVSVIDRPIESTKEMTEDEAEKVLRHIDDINRVDKESGEIVDADVVEGDES